MLEFIELFMHFKGHICYFDEKLEKKNSSVRKVWIKCRSCGGRDGSCSHLQRQRDAEGHPREEEMTGRQVLGVTIRQQSQVSPVVTWLTTSLNEGIPPRFAPLRVKKTCWVSSIGPKWWCFHTKTNISVVGLETWQDPVEEPSLYGHFLDLRKLCGKEGSCDVAGRLLWFTVWGPTRLRIILITFSELLLLHTHILGQLGRFQFQGGDFQVSTFIFHIFT